MIILGGALIVLALVVSLFWLKAQIGKRTLELQKAVDRIQAQNEALEKEIIDRKDIEVTLQKARRDYQTIFDAVPEMIWYVDKQHKIIRANQAAARSLKAPVEQLVGKSMYELFGAEAVKFCQNNAAIIESGMPKFGIKEMYITPQGDERWVQISKVPYYDQQSAIAGLIIVAEDITERETAALEREQLITELQEAVTKIKTLTGMIPICSHCKKIRDDKGSWNKLEAFLMEHSDAEFSHGICPDCMKKLYPDYYRNKQNSE